MTDTLSKGYLISIADDEEELKYPMTTDVCLIGTGSDCNIRLRDEEISDHHCVIKYWNFKKVTIQSLNCEHPVLLNNKEVSREECLLESGDVIQLMHYNFRWRKTDIQNEDSIENGNTSLNIENTEKREKHIRYSAPARLLEDDSQEYKDDIVQSEEATQCIVEEMQPEDDERKTILENLNVPHDYPLIKTPDKDETIKNEQHSAIQTPKHFEETYHSTPKISPNDELQKECSSTRLTTSMSNLVDNLLDVSGSPAKLRGRRSTGIVPCVGTPSDVYRTTRSILTPGFRSCSNKVPNNVETSNSKPGLLGSSKKFPRQRSSERKSTPLKSRISDKSINRESILHSPIIENYSLEKFEEVQNESNNTESKYRFVASRRRKRSAGNSFAVENRIAEESETSKSELSDETGSDVDEVEESLIDIDSYCDNSEGPMSARIIINGDTNGDTYSNSELNSTFTIDETTEPFKECASENKGPIPKSILTPLPKAGSTTKEKSAKKVTFARNIILESSEQNSLQSNGFQDSYEFNSQHSFNLGDTSERNSNACSSVDTSSLASFCRNEELYMSDKSHLEHSNTTSVGSPFSTPVKGGERHLETPNKSFGHEIMDDDIREITKTPVNSPSNQISSFSVRDSVGISTEDDVDLTRAEKLQYMEDISNRGSAGQSVISNISAKSMSPTRSPSPDECEKFVTPPDSPIINSYVESNEPSTTPRKSDSKSFNAPSASASVIVIEESKTPLANYENVAGMKRMFKTPCENKISYEDVEGLELLMRTPHVSTPCRGNVEDVQEVMNTPKATSFSDELFEEPSHVKQTMETADTISPTEESEIQDTSSNNIQQQCTPLKQSGASICENKESPKLVPYIRTPGRDSNEKIQSSLIVGTPQFVSNADDVTSLMKSCADIDSAQESTLLPCTSTPHPKIESSFHLSSVLQTDSQQISEISEVCPPTMSAGEIHSQDQCNLPDVAVLESRSETEIVSGEASIPDNAEPQASTSSQPQVAVSGTETPKANYENVEGMKRIFKTPCEMKSSYENVKGVKEIFKTPSDNRITYENVQGMKEMFKTPSDNRITYENVQGMKEMFKTPYQVKTYENTDGVKQMFKTPVESKSTYENVSGVKELLKTPHGSSSDCEVIECVTESLKTPNIINSETPKIRSVDVQKVDSTPTKTSESLISHVRSETINGIIEGVQELPESPPRSKINVVIDCTISETETIPPTEIESEKSPAKGSQSVELLVMEETMSPISDPTETALPCEVECESSVTPVVKVKDSSSSINSTEMRETGPEHSISVSEVETEKLERTKSTRNVSGSSPILNEVLKTSPTITSITSISMNENKVDNISQSLEVGNDEEKTKEMIADTTVGSSTPTLFLEEPEEHTENAEVQKFGRLSRMEVVLTRTNSPSINRSRNISKTENEVIKLINDVEKRETRSVSRRGTPLKVDNDIERSATKRARIDRDNQENEVRFNIRTGDTPNTRRKQTPLKKDCESPLVTKPIFQIVKHVTPVIDEEAERMRISTEFKGFEQPIIERKRSARLKNIENVYTVSPRSKRPFRKSDDNEEALSTPTRVARTSVLKSTSPFSIILHSSDVVNNEEVNFMEELEVNKGTNEESTIKNKRASNKRIEKATISDENSSEDRGQQGQDTGSGEPVTCRSRKNATEEEVPVSDETSHTTNKPVLKKIEIVLSPTSVIPEAVSPKRATRKGQQEVSQNVVETSPPKRSLRNRRKLATVQEDAPAEVKTRRNVRGRQVQSEECADENKEVSEEKPKRMTRNKTVKKSTAEPVAEVKNSRSTRGKGKVEEPAEKKITAVETKTKRVTRGSREKLNECVTENTTYEEPKNKRVTRGGRGKREEFVEIIEALPKRVTRGRKVSREESNPAVEASGSNKGLTRKGHEQSVAITDNAKPSNSRNKRKATLNEGKQDVDVLEPKVEPQKILKATRRIVKAKNIDSSENDNAEEPSTSTQKTTRSRLIDDEESETGSMASKNSTTRSTRRNNTKVGDENGSKAKRQSVTVSRLSVTVKIVKKRSATVEEASSEEPERKRGKHAKPVKTVVTRKSITVKRKVNQNQNSVSTKTTKAVKKTITSNKDDSNEVDYSASRRRPTRVSCAGKTAAAPVKNSRSTKVTNTQEAKPLKKVKFSSPAETPAPRVTRSSMMMTANSSAAAKSRSLKKK